MCTSYTFLGVKEYVHWFLLIGVVAAVCENYETRILVGEGESFYAGGASSLSYDLEYIDDALSVGRIEVCFECSWRALCSSDWTKQDASVVCQQLGFAAAG